MIENSKALFRSFNITIIVIVLMGCTSIPSSSTESHSGEVSQEEFYGDWNNDRVDYIMEVNLSSESWVAKYSYGSYYTIDQLNWVPAVNDDPATKNVYPKGYYITGTVSQLYNVTGTMLGSQLTLIIYLNNDKTAFLRKAENSSNYVFTRMSD